MLSINNDFDLSYSYFKCIPRMTKQLFSLLWNVMHVLSYDTYNFDENTAAQYRGEM